MPVQPELLFVVVDGPAQKLLQNLEVHLAFGARLRKQLFEAGNVVGDNVSRLCFRVFCGELLHYEVGLHSFCRSLASSASRRLSFRLSSTWRGTCFSLAAIVPR